MNATSETSPRQGTAQEPVTGDITRGSVLISNVEHWRDGDVYFLRSTEFDAYAEDTDFQTAVIRFGQTVEDLATYLAQLVRAGDASENEREVYDLISPRLIESYRLELAELDKDRDRLISVHIGRRRRRRRGIETHWAPRTTPGNSSQPSPA